MRSIAFLFAFVIVVSACGDSEDGANPERFCELLDEIETQDTSDMPLGEALPIIEEGRDKYAETLEVAPDEIRADAETFHNFVLEITDLLIAAGGDEAQVDLVAFQAISDDGVDAASQNVGAWRASNCS